MNEDTNPQETQTPPVQETPQVSQESVSFSPIPVKQKSRGGVKTFLGIFILIIFVVGGFLIFKDNGETSVEPTPVSEVGGVSIESPTPTPEPVDKTKIVISIENGTGIVGEAAYLRDILKSSGYSQFKVGNASTTDNVTTTVTFASSLDQATKDEITAKLNNAYKEVSVSNSSTQKDDVLIVTGLKKGATAKPSATPSASPSTSPSSSPTPTPTSAQ